MQGWPGRLSINVSHIVYIGYVLLRSLQRCRFHVCGDGDRRPNPPC
jgi:hypothetical protein